MIPAGKEGYSGGRGREWNLSPLERATRKTGGIPNSRLDRADNGPFSAIFPLPGFEGGVVEPWVRNRAPIIITNENKGSNLTLQPIRQDSPLRKPEIDTQYYNNVGLTPDELRVANQNHRSNYSALIFPKPPEADSQDVATGIKTADVLFNGQLAGRTVDIQTDNDFQTPPKHQGVGFQRNLQNLARTFADLYNDIRENPNRVITASVVAAALAACNSPESLAKNPVVPPMQTGVAAVETAIASRVKTTEAGINNAIQTLDTERDIFFAGRSNPSATPAVEQPKTPPVPQATVTSRPDANPTAVATGVPPYFDITGVYDDKNQTQKKTYELITESFSKRKLPAGVYGAIKVNINVSRDNPRLATVDFGGARSQYIMIGEGTNRMVINPLDVKQLTIDKVLDWYASDRIIDSGRFPPRIIGNFIIYYQYLGYYPGGPTPVSPVVVENPRTSKPYVANPLAAIDIRSGKKVEDLNILKTLYSGSGSTDSISYAGGLGNITQDQVRIVKDNAGKPYITDPWVTDDQLNEAYPELFPAPAMAGFSWMIRDNVKSLVNEKDGTIVATLDPKAGVVRWDSQYLASLNRFIKQDATAEDKATLANFLSVNKLFVIYDSATEANGYTPPPNIIIAKDKTTILSPIPGPKGTDHFEYDTNKRKIVAKTASNDSICYITDDGLDYTPTVEFVKTLPILFHRDEDTQLVQQELVDLVIEYPNLQQVTFEQNFLEYWKNKYGKRVDFDVFKNNFSPYSMRQALKLLDSITIGPDTRATHLGYSSISTDGTVYNATIGLNDKDTLHPDGLSPSTTSFFRRVALLKETVANLMLSKLFSDFHLTFSEKNEFDQPLALAMVENASSAVGYQFLKEHDGEVPTKDKVRYNSRKEGSRIYMTQPKVNIY